MGISTTSQPRAKRKLDRAQPQEEGRHRSCAAPNGASAECQSKTTGSRPWLKLYRRYAAKERPIFSFNHPQLPHQEDALVGGVANAQLEGLALSVPRFAIDPQQHGLLRRIR